MKNTFRKLPKILIAVRKQNNNNHNNNNNNIKLKQMTFVNTLVRSKNVFRIFVNFKTITIIVDATDFRCASGSFISGSRDVMTMLVAFYSLSS